MWEAPAISQLFSIRRGIAVALACAVAALWAPAAWARTGKLDGTLGALPSGTEAPLVEAVTPRGTIAGLSLLNGSGAFSLSVPAGTYVLASDAYEGETPYSAFSAPERVRAGGTDDVRKQLSLRAHAAVRARAAGVLPHGAIVTVTSFEFTDDRNPAAPTTVQLRNLLINDLFRACTAKGTVFVDTSPEFVAFAKQELGLSRSGKLSTPFDYHPLKPQYEIIGSASVESKEGDILRTDLNVSMTANHLAVDSAQVESEATFAEFNLGDLDTALAKLSAEFATKNC